MWLSPKQAAENMSNYAFDKKYRMVVKALGGDDEYKPETCDFDITRGCYITPNGERGIVHFIDKEDQ